MFNSHQRDVVVTNAANHWILLGGKNSDIPSWEEFRKAFDKLANIGLELNSEILVHYMKMTRHNGNK